MINREGYLNYIHLFRGFAILIIVGIHCRISFRWIEDSIFRDIFTALLDSGTVLFVFIAGFLFQYLRHKFEYSTFIKRKFKYVVVPYLIVSIPAIFSDLYVGDMPVWAPNIIADYPKAVHALYMIFTGKHLGPFWFIPMITIFYIIAPLLLKMDRPIFYKYGFPLLFMAGLFTYRFGYFSTTVSSFVHYLPVYIFGMWASRYRFKLVNLKSGWIITLSIIYIIIALLEITNMVFVPRLRSFEEAAITPYFSFNFAKLKVSLICIVLIWLFYRAKKSSQSLKLLGDYSFGIYFIHLYVITAIEIVVRAFWPDFTQGPLTFILYTIIVTALSLLIVHVVKKIFGRKSRLVIGS